MLGDPDSCGVWAPCLTHADGLFHLIYTDVKRYGRMAQPGASGATFRDFHNYLVTSPRIEGPWSDPIYLNSSGFDPSLFHDDDGRKYLVNMVWDHRPGHEPFRRHRAAGVLGRGTEAGRDRDEMIFTGTAIGFTEAPHLYKRHGFYYLITAEGGTGWGHAVTMARSRSIDGPVRAAPGRLHPERASSPRRGAAARRPRRPRRHAGRRDLHGLPVRPAAAQPRPLHARPRNRDPADDVVRRWLAADRRRRRAFHT